MFVFQTRCLADRNTCVVITQVMFPQFVFQTRCLADRNRIRRNTILKRKTVCFLDAMFSGSKLNKDNFDFEGCFRLFFRRDVQRIETPISQECKHQKPSLFFRRDVQRIETNLGKGCKSQRLVCFLDAMFSGSKLILHFPFNSYHFRLFFRRDVQRIETYYKGVSKNNKMRCLFFRRDVQRIETRKQMNNNTAYTLFVFQTRCLADRNTRSFSNCSFSLSVCFLDAMFSGSKLKQHLSLFLFCHCLFFRRDVQRIETTILSTHDMPELFVFQTRCLADRNPQKTRDLLSSQSFVFQTRCLADRNQKA